MKTSTVHNVEGVDIAVTTKQTSTFPPVFHIRAEHPSGAFHEHTLTVGDVDLKKIATLEDAQKALDSARQTCAEMANKKAALAKLAEQIQ